MDYHYLAALRRTHPAWRLLVADHAPLIIGFLHASFIEPNIRTQPHQVLAARLDDHLFQLREQLGDPTAFPRLASQYLDDWASDEHAWLRKYYPIAVDEPHYDITPATERAIDWLAGLGQRQFIGTESRLLTVFELLYQLTEVTSENPDARMTELERRKARIDADIERLRNGQPLLRDPTLIKDCFLQMASTARGLLSDFREVEQNFRELDRSVRARVAAWDSSKGALLDTIFGQSDAIAESDQGRSFRAFWDFLMSPDRQEELSAMLRGAFRLAPVQELKPDARLLRIHYDWLEAGEVTQRTVARLSEQLRRYLDDQVFLENRRIIQLIRDVEQHALAIRDDIPDAWPVSIDDVAPTIDLIMDRPLFTPPFTPLIVDRTLDVGDGDVPVDALFDQVAIDTAQLARHIRRALQTRPEISLAHLVDLHPLEHGLAELVAYLGLASDDRATLIDDSRTETVPWTDEMGDLRRATVPLVVFKQPGAAPAALS